MFGLVIMNTAVWSSSLACKSSRSTRPVALLLTVTASKPAMAALAGLVPWALSGIEHLRALLALVAEVGRGDEQRRQFALRPGGRLQRHGVAGRRSRRGSPASRRAVAACPERVVVLAAGAGRRCPAARRAARSAWGCTSSCTSRADRNCVSIDMFRVDRLMKWRTRSISPSSGSGGGASATAPRGSRSLSGRSGTSHAGSRWQRRPGVAHLEQQVGRLDLVHDRFAWIQTSPSRRPIASAVQASPSSMLDAAATQAPCGQAVDLGSRALLGDGDAEAVGQVGIPAAQRQAGVVAGARAASASSVGARRLGTRTTNSLKNGPVERQSNARQLASAARPRSGPCAGTARPSRASPAGPGRPGRCVARRANRPWLVQMLLVAFSRRMCCSRVCSVSTQQRLPLRSTVWPTSRPGILRTNSSRQAMMPRYGPP